ncbi:MAG: TRAP transporter small permease [Pseudomonadota bacterium]|nr:TRAP transporter small permease [Pseudomonadota bacterium]
MQAIAKAHMQLLLALKNLAGIIIFISFILIVIDVGLNLFGYSGLEGTMGVVEYGLLWFTLLAAPWLARIRGHVYIDALTELFNPNVQQVAARFAYIVAIAGSSLSGYFSVELLWEAYVDEQVDERGVELMQWWLYAPMPVGFFLVAIEFLRYLLGMDDMYSGRTEVKEGM